MNRKRILALVISSLLLVGGYSTGVFADEDDQNYFVDAQLDSAFDEGLDESADMMPMEEAEWDTIEVEVGNFEGGAIIDAEIDNDSIEFETEYVEEDGIQDNYAETEGEEIFNAEPDFVVEDAELQYLDEENALEVCEEPLLQEADDVFGDEVTSIVYNGHTYALYNDSASWDEAKLFCEDKGGHLVTITSPEEQEIINSQLLKSATKYCYWIGLSRESVGTPWDWITGETFDYSNWSDGEPNDQSGNNETCVELYGVSFTDGFTKVVGTWNDSSAEGSDSSIVYYTLENTGFICEWEYEISNEYDIDDETEDEVASVVYNGHTYTLYNDSASWNEAKSLCEDKGGHLVTITSPGEQEIINSQLLKSATKYCYWIGLSRESVGTPWNWVTGEIFNYSNWSDGEPNDQSGNNETCVELYGVSFTDGFTKVVGTWNDSSAEGSDSSIVYYTLENTGFICEWEYDISNENNSGWQCGDKIWANLEDGVLTISGTGSMDDYSRSTAPWYGLSDSIYTVVIENGVTNISSWAFCDCSVLNTTYIPKTVMEIKKGAFDGCTALREVWYDGTISDLHSIPLETDNNELLEANAFSNIKLYNGGFYFSNDKENIIEMCHYTDNYFSGDNFSYNHSLARMTLALAMSGFSKAGEEGSIQNVDPYMYTYRNEWDQSYYGHDEERKLENTYAGNVAQLLDLCGFTNIHANEDYLLTNKYMGDGENSINDGNNISACFAEKKLEDGSLLLAVVIRGAGYGDEWIGDFNVYGSDTEHIGFSIAASQIEAELSEYLEKYNTSVDSNLKLWITGYSRAAAIANLMAGHVCERKAPNCHIIRPENVFAYTFETPMGRKNWDTKTSLYNGIWNIVNPIDAVPMVAMNRWGYSRYGHDVFLPAKETCNGAFAYYESAVCQTFNELTGNNYSHIPQARMQGYILKETIDEIAKLAKDDSSSLTAEVQYLLQLKYKDPEQLKRELQKLYGELKDFVDRYVDDNSIASALLIAIYYIRQNFGTIKNAITIATNLNGIVCAHMSEMTYSWMMAIPVENINSDGSIKYGASEFVAGMRERLLLCRCPIDIMVYDRSGELQLSILDNEVYEETGCMVDAIVDEDGQKIISIPSDVSVDIKIVATDSGEVNCSTHEMDFTGESADVITFYDSISIQKDDVIKACVNTSYTDLDDEYKIFDQKQIQVFPTETLSIDQVPSVNVSLDVFGSGNVEGGGYRNYGDFVKIKAIPNDAESFLGWYDENDELIATDPEYSFCIWDDVVLIAKFTENNAGQTIENEHVLIEHKAVAATCTEDGNSAYWSCDQCDGFFSDAEGKTPIVEDSWIIAATGHNMTEHKAMAATCTEAGNSAYWSCDQCDGFFSDAEGKTPIDENSWVIPAKGHISTVSIDAKEATCTEAGNTAEIICTECGEIIQGRTSIPALNHDWSDWITTRAATTTDVGIETRTCGRCGMKETKEIAKLKQASNETTPPTQTPTVTPAPKQTQSMTVKAKKPSVNASKVKKKKQTISKSKAFTIKNAKGKVTFKKVSGKKNLTISSSGKITVKKGTKKGTYKIKVEVSAAGDNTYAPMTKTITVKVKVK